jgi:hypothetical protein
MSEANQPGTWLLADAAADATGGAIPNQAAADTVSAAFAAAVQQGQLDLPLPGRGRTRDRWAALADLAGEDLSLARLAKSHADARAILSELGTPAPPAGSRWGVWTAPPADAELTARQDGEGWWLDGIKQYCPGARTCTHALVTATASDGHRLFTVSTRDLWPLPGTWRAIGLAASDTLDVSFDGIAAEPLGEPGRYTARPGFAHASAEVTACWYGGARALGQTLRAAATQRDIGPYALAHLGAIDTALHTARMALDQAAAEIDADPGDREGGGRSRALRLQILIEAIATDVMRRVGRALGADPLCRDAGYSRRVADLTVYLRQHHAERDLAQLGALVASGGAAW